MSKLNYLFSRKKKSLVTSLFLLTLFMLVLMSMHISPNQAYNEEIGNITTQFEYESTIETDDIPDFDWVVMNYIDGDNNLEEEAIEDLNEMEAEFSATARIAVVVLIDRTPGYDESNGDWTGTRLYNVTYDITDTITSNMLQDMGELNMGSSATLENFLDYCFSNFYSDRYWLNLWDHGGGVDGICWDDTSGSDSLTIEEMQTAIENSEATNSKYIDLISHDACFMNMIEVGYELRDLCDYFVGSEESVPGDGFDYETIISDLVSNSNMNASTLANLLVDAYESFYNPIVDYVTLSALNLSAMDQFLLAVNNFAGNLTWIVNDGQGKGIEEAFFETQTFYGDYSIDFQDFVEELLSNTTLMTNYPDLNTSSIYLLQEFYNLILNNYQHSCYSGDANGVSVFMPYNDPFINVWIENYIDSVDIFAGIDWLTYTFWNEFLDVFYTAGYGERTFEYEQMFLDTTIGPLALGENDEVYYYIAILETAVYEVTCEVISGDADLYLYDVSYGDFIASSLYFNPDDGDYEKIRLLLTPGYYFVNVFAYSSSSFNFDMTQIAIPELAVNVPVTSISGTQEGDDYGHYIQTFYHYYSFTANISGTYTFTLSYNSYNVDYDLYLLDDEFYQIDSSIETTDTDSISYLMTVGETVYLFAYGYSGHGSFTLIVTNPEITETPTTSETNTFPFNGFTIVLSSLGIIASSMYLLIKRKKKFN